MSLALWRRVALWIRRARLFGPATFFKFGVEGDITWGDSSASAVLTPALAITCLTFGNNPLGTHLAKRMVTGPFRPPKCVGAARAFA